MCCMWNNSRDLLDLGGGRITACGFGIHRHSNLPLPLFMIVTKPTQVVNNHKLPIPNSRLKEGGNTKKILKEV